MAIPSDWWSTFFHGAAVDLWVHALPAEYTDQETTAILRLLNAPEGAELLDVPCGHGRHAVALAARGYRVVGVDLSAELLSHARAADSAGRVRWEQRDMRDLPWRARFDGAFCFGNSFGYMDADANAAFLRAVAAALKPGARFVLDTPMVLENLMRHLENRLWIKAGEVYLLAANDYDPRRGRLDIEYTFVSDGRVDVRHGSHQAYTYRELIDLFEDAGFGVEPAEPWTRESRSVRFVGIKR